MKYDIILYGSDTSESAYPEKSTIEALSDVKKFEPNALSLAYNVEFYNTGEEYLNGVQNSDYRPRGKWMLKVRSKQFPQAVSSRANATSLNDYFPVELLGKKYHYLYFGDKYPLQPDALISATNPSCMPVAVKGFHVEDDNGLKSIIMELWEREV